MNIQHCVVCGRFMERISLSTFESVLWLCRVDGFKRVVGGGRGTMRFQMKVNQDDPSLSVGDILTIRIDTDGLIGGYGVRILKYYHSDYDGERE